MLEKICRGPVDPMFELKYKADNDTDPRKIDLGVGVYRNEAGSYQELEVVRQVKLPDVKLTIKAKCYDRPRKSCINSTWATM
jgi:aspartate/tyrosine/aromatic aminotransferase